MGHHNDPINWDYSDHPNKSLVRYRCVRLGGALLSNPSQFTKSNCSDTLLAHKYIFRQFTPKNFSYYAGNYRGARYNILETYPIWIAGKPGESPKSVKTKMTAFDSQFLKVIEYFSFQFANGKVDPNVLRAKLVEAFGILLVRFFVIHPYANGNGHIGRMLALTMLGRLGIMPFDWTIDDRPPYDEAISEHRRGNAKPLNKVLAKCFYG
jgi:fido (protein-threonine AMPylation protein)